MQLVYQRPKLYQKQQQAFFNDKRYSFIEGSTKSGKTVASMAWLLEQALAGTIGQNFLWVAPIYSQAKIAFRRFNLGMPREIFTTNASDLYIEFVNGVRIWFKGGDNPDSIYGEDYHAAVIDEASRCHDDVWTAVRSTLTATQGPIRAIGNVKGRGNWHYKLCRKAESGDKSMHYSKLTAYDAVDAGVLPAEEIEDARRQMPDNVFRELYLAEPSDDGGNPFGLKAINECVGPISNEPAKFWGWDLAKSFDFTVGIALDSEGRTCRVERFQKPWQDTIRTIRDTVGSSAPALIDSTGVGDPVLEALQQGRSNFEGFKFSSSSKQMLMEGLAVAIQSRQISYPDGPIVQELQNFEYEYTRTGVKYSAPQGLHDDCVCALALAVSRKNTAMPGAGWMGYYEQLSTQLKATHV